MKINFSITMGRMTFAGYVCDRCEHKWAARYETKPRLCPNCKTTYWDTPTRREIALKKATKKIYGDKK